MKCRRVSFGMILVLGRIKFARLLVNQMILARHFTCVHFIGGAMFGHFFQLTRTHVLVGQLAKHFLCALRHVARAGEHECERTDRFGHEAERDLVAGVADGLASHLARSVVVSGTDVHEGRVMAECEESEADAVHDVDHADDARILPECDDSLAMFVHHFLIVDHQDVLLKKN